MAKTENTGSYQVASVFSINYESEGRGRGAEVAEEKIVDCHL